MKMACFAAILTIVGCATSTQIKTPEGVQHLIECDGTAVPWSTCYKKAAQVCPSGFETLEKNTSATPTAVATEQVASIGAVERKSIMVKSQ
jgi:hypothetical protein